MEKNIFYDNFELPKWVPDFWLKNWTIANWQLKNSISNPAILKELGLKLPENLLLNNSNFRMAITPFFLSLCFPKDPQKPILELLNQVLPTKDEINPKAGELRDPLGEEVHKASEGLIHRYGDRALWLITTPSCPIYCRYCTRKRVTSLSDYRPKKEHIEPAISYLKSNPQIKEVILSGGDPLLLANEKLRDICKAIRNIDHIDHIRIGSRFLTANPFRFNEELFQSLMDLGPITFMVHINHFNEISDQMLRVVKMGRKFGFSFKNQGVLLKGINDDFETLEKLCRRLSRIGIDPHYFFLCDPIVGSHHFWIDPGKAQAIYREFQNKVSSLSRPRFVLDLPGGKGKVELIEQNMRKKLGFWEFKDKNEQWVPYPYS